MTYVLGEQPAMYLWLFTNVRMSYTRVFLTVCVCKTNEWSVKDGRNLNTQYVNGKQVFMTVFVAYLGEITFLNNTHVIQYNSGWCIDMTRH